MHAHRMRSGWAVALGLAVLVLASASPLRAQAEPAGKPPAPAPRPPGDIKSPLWWLERARVEAAKLSGTDMVRMYLPMFTVPVYAKLGDLAGFDATVAELPDRELRAEMAKYKPEALARSGDFAGAAASAAALKGDRERTKAYGAIAAAQLKAGDATGAKRSWDAAKAAKTPSDPDQMGWCCQAQVRAGDLAAAKATADEITDARFKSTAWLTILTAQAKAGALADAQAILPEIKGDEQRPAHCALAKAQAKAGDLAAARQSIEAAKAIADGAKRETDKVGPYASIALAQHRIGDTADAEKSLQLVRTIASQATDTEEKASLLVKLAVAQARMGDAAKTRQAVDAARAAGAGARNRRNSYDNDTKFAQIAAAQILAGDEAGAAATLSDFDVRDRVIRIPLLSLAQAKGGDLEKVWAWTQRLTEPGERVLAYAGVAVALVPDDVGGEELAEFVGYD